MKRATLVVMAAVAAMLLLAWSAPAFAQPFATGVSAPVFATAETTLGTEPTGTTEPTPTVEPTGTVEPTPTVEPAFPTWMKRYWLHRVHRVRTTRRVVALTFDDGPNSRTKPAIRILDAFGAKGTFFAIGDCSRMKGMAAVNRYVLASGNELANHTMHHQRLDKSLATDVKAINDLEKLLIAQTGRGTRWVRAMGGDVNSTGLKATRKTNHLYAQWSVSIADSVRGYTPPSRLYHNVVDHVRPGAVVLMHVTHPETLAALPSIVRELKRRGYQMVTLSQMAAMGYPYP
jgi:peptidoglycan-N-acetylglucosamine deacetylase